MENFRKRIDAQSCAFVQIYAVVVIPADHDD
jgi:hypothetical protein